MHSAAPPPAEDGRTRHRSGSGPPCRGGVHQRAREARNDTARTRRPPHPLPLPARLSHPMPSSSSESRPLLLGSEGRYESASEGSEPSLSDAASSELAAAMASDITGATCAPQRHVGRSENGADGFGSMSGCHAVAAHTTRSDAEALGAGATRACAALFGVVSQWPLAQARP